MTVRTKKDLDALLVKTWKGGIDAKYIRDMYDTLVQPFKETSVTVETAAVTLTGAKLLTGIITANIGTTAAANYTLPSGADMDTALGDTFVVGESFEFSIVNISTHASEDVTVIQGATNFTVVGNMTVASNDAVGTVSFARFLALKTAADTFVLYRIG